MTTSWILPEVAEAQYAVVVRELEKPSDAVSPFRYFVEAMTAIPIKPGWSLLDAACGAGAYAALCARNYPRLRYVGADLSPHMIERARTLNPEGTFQVCEFSQNTFDQHQIVLVSAVLEYAGGWDALDLLISQFKRYAILHRLRLTDAPSHAVDEPTYAGHRENYYVWNRQELKDRLGDLLVREIPWSDGQQATLVLKR